MYAKARPSVLDGKPTLTKGIKETSREALGRIGTKTDLTKMERAYNSGKSTQVPTGRVIGVFWTRGQTAELVPAVHLAHQTRPKDGNILHGFCTD